MSDRTITVRGREVVLKDVSDEIRNAPEGIRRASALLQAHLERFSNWYRSMHVRPRFDELRRDLPYVLHEVDAADRYILVNRNYKPLGVPSEDWEDYEKYPQIHISLSKEQLRSVVHPKHEHGLFGDGSAPWLSKQNARAYVERLERLLKLLR